MGESSSQTRAVQGVWILLCKWLGGWGIPLTYNVTYLGCTRSDPMFEWNLGLRLQGLLGSPAYVNSSREETNVSRIRVSTDGLLYGSI